MDKKCIDCQKKCTGIRCKRCSNIHKARLTSLRHNVDIENLQIDLLTFTVTDTNGNRVPVKMKFPFSCIGCGNRYSASVVFEKGKKHPWHCKSCAIHLEWLKDAYYNKHVDSIKEVLTCENHRKRLSELSRKNWANPEIRAAMMDRDFIVIAAKSKATYVANLLSGKTVYKTPHGKRSYHGGVWMRSTYEQRFAVILDSLELEWQYEPKCFGIFNDTKTYLPDFYIPKLELYVEVKGWWRDDAREKFDVWVAQYPHLKYAIIDKSVLDLLERKEKELETCIVASRG